MRLVTFLLALALLVGGTIAGVLHGQCFYLKNVYYKEYLYTNADRKVQLATHSASKVPVFTWRKLSDGPASQWSKTFGESHKYQGVWLFEDKPCTDCYSIKSVFSNPESLYSVASADPEFQKYRPRRPVYAYKEDHAFPEEEGEDTWKIEMVPNGKLGQVRIQSKHIGSASGEVLFAVSDDEAFDTNRRKVFTWSSKEDSIAFAQQGEWFLERASCPPDVFV